MSASRVATTECCASSPEPPRPESPVERTEPEKPREPGECFKVKMAKSAAKRREKLASKIAKPYSDIQMQKLQRAASRAFAVRGISL